MKWQERFDLKPPHYRDGNITGFGVQNPDLIFDMLELHEGHCFLDAGCGPGEYSMFAAERVGASGSVIALDRDESMIEQVQSITQGMRTPNIHCHVADLGSPLPLESNSVDVVLISGVLHMPGLDESWNILFPELHRALRPEGRLGIIESNNKAASSDLPLHLRLTPETIADQIKPYGFYQYKLLELSARALVVFKKQNSHISK